MAASVLAMLLVLLSPAGAPADRSPTITGLGRLEPKDGVMRVAGPSQEGVVIGRLLVEKGDRVKKGQRIAVLDSYALREADVARLQAELTNAEREFLRVQQLYQKGISSDSTLERAEMEKLVGLARLRGARALLDLAVVRSPVAGRVLEVHAYTGERVAEAGIVEIGRTDEMYAIAEIYETDVKRIAPGQRAVVRSSALPEPLHGTVERIGLKIGKMDVLGTDPAAKTDARVVEVEIRLDDGKEVSGLTYLQVEVEITP